MKLYEYKLNTVNPFLSDTVNHIERGEKVIMMGNKDADMMINKDGDIQAHSLFAKKIKIDKAQFAKIYLGSLAAWFELSKTGIRMFTYIVQTIKPNQDSFMLHYAKCMEQTGYKSKKSISNGLKELIENKFIARGENQYIYFINPTIFFNGDRITFLEQYEIKKELQSKHKPSLDA